MDVAPLQLFGARPPRHQLESAAVTGDNGYSDEQPRLSSMLLLLRPPSPFTLNSDYAMASIPAGFILFITVSRKYSPTIILGAHGARNVAKP